MAKAEVNEVVRPLILNDKRTGATYTLEFNRDAVKFAEDRGFDIGNVTRFPMTAIPDLFYYAFRMNHKNVPRDKTDKILFEDMNGISGAALERLVMLYNQSLEVLFEKDGNEDADPTVTVTL